MLERVVTVELIELMSNWRCNGKRQAKSNWLDQRHYFQRYSAEWVLALTLKVIHAVCTNERGYIRSFDWNW